MNSTNAISIDWQSQYVLSDIANKINQPLAEIIRLTQHIQDKTKNADYETNRLSTIMLESSEQIENLILDIIRIEENKRIEVLVHDKFKFPHLYSFHELEEDNINEEATAQRISKTDFAWLMQLEKTILNHLDYHGLSVPWLARQLAVSERQIFRKIEKFTGLTPNKYIRSLKLSRAKELLENYAVSTVNEAAATVGIKDPYYFTKLYQLQFGKKPKSYLL